MAVTYMFSDSDLIQKYSCLTVNTSFSLANASRHFLVVFVRYVRAFESRLIFSYSRLTIATYTHVLKHTELSFFFEQGINFGGQDVSPNKKPNKPLGNSEWAVIILLLSD